MSLDGSSALNACQNAEGIAVAIKPKDDLVRAASLALALLDPDWAAAIELKAAIAAARLPVAKIIRRKSNKIPFACDAGAKPWPAKEWPCLEPMRYMAKGSMAKFNIAIKAAGMKGALESKEATISRLTLCACGHAPSAHESDSLENLLECDAPGCNCDHFHYDNGAKSAQAEAA